MEKRRMKGGERNRAREEETERLRQNMEDVVKAENKVVGRGNTKFKLITRRNQQQVINHP